MSEHERRFADAADSVSALRRKARRVWILIAGTAVVLVGVLISPLPGPGLSVLGPLGIAILASEFVWAQRLAAELRDRSRPLRNAAEGVARATPRYTVVPVCAAYWGATVPIELWTAIPSLVLWPTASVLFVPVWLWASMVLRK